MFFTATPNSSDIADTTERMRIDAYGNVGIGTTTPTALLDVNGSMLVGASMRAGYNTNIASFFGRAAVGYAGWNDRASFAHVDHNTQTNYALIQDFNGKTLINAADGESILFNINNVEKMKMLSDGKFGI